MQWNNHLIYFDMSNNSSRVKDYWLQFIIKFNFLSFFELRTIPLIPTFLKILGGSTNWAMTQKSLRVDSICSKYKSEHNHAVSRNYFRFLLAKNKWRMVLFSHSDCQRKNTFYNGKSFEVFKITIEIPTLHSTSSIFYLLVWGSPRNCLWIPQHSLFRTTIIKWR